MSDFSKLIAYYETPDCLRLIADAMDDMDGELPPRTFRMDGDQKIKCVAVFKKSKTGAIIAKAWEYPK